MMRDCLEVLPHPTTKRPSEAHALRIGTVFTFQSDLEGASYLVDLAGFERTGRDAGALPHITHQLLSISESDPERPVGCRLLFEALPVDLL